MIWKVYLLACFYNLAFCTGITCYGLYNDLQSQDFDPFILIIYLALAIAFIKNLIGYRFVANLSTPHSHNDTIGFAFYFLWLLNLLITLAITIGFWSLIQEDRSTIPASAFETGMTIAFGMAGISSAYTIIFDIPLERKHRKKQDPADELLQEYHQNS